MDRFELDMGQPGLYDGWKSVLSAVQKSFEIGYAVFNCRVRRGNEQSSPRAAASDPILRAAEFAGIFAAAPATRKQLFMNLANEPRTQREPPAQPGQAVLHGGDIV